MKPSFVVLTSPSETARRTAHYAAALGAGLSVHLTLLHVCQGPSLLAPEQAWASASQTDRHFADATARLHRLARQLPGPADARVSAMPVPYAVAKAVEQLRPLLLVLGLSPEHSLLDQLLHNQLLPVLQATRQPLLLVPQAATAPGLPRRVVLAIDAEPYQLTAAARALAPLLADWQAAYTVVHVRGMQAPQPHSDHQVLAAVRAYGLLPPDAPLWLYREAAATAAAGILQALVDTQANLLMLLVRPHSFLGSLFRHSVTAEVLRSCPVPVLLVPAAGPELPAWMPAMS